MLKNYFKIAWRHLGKSKIFSAINIFGLSVGLAVCILILLFVSYEKSFDEFQPKNIYRLDEVQKFPGMLASQKVALSMFPMGPTLKHDFPEVLQFTRIHWQNKVELTYGQNRIFVPQMLYVDSTFLQMFHFTLLRGNRKTALQEPHSILLTQQTATKLFGSEDPMGRTVIHYGDDTNSFKVTGILQDVPQNSQIQFDGLYSFNTIYKADLMNDWGGNWLDTYLTLAPGTDIGSMENEFPKFLKKHMHGDGSKVYVLFLLKFQDVHGASKDIGLDYLNYQKFDKGYVDVFFAIAVIVLLIAIVNFINLSTARSAERAREVGIRKSIGAQRVQLGIQFIGESVLMCAIALILAIGLVKLALPGVNGISHRDLHLNSFGGMWILATCFIGPILIGFISGLYPALYLSSFRPSRVLKGSIQTGGNKSTIRNLLVVVQFTVAVLLIIGTMFAVRQMGFMENTNPGFIRDGIINIPLDGITYQKYKTFKQVLIASPLIKGVTASQDELGSHLDQSGMSFQGKGPRQDFSTTRLIVDPDYLKVYHIQLAYGSDFSKDPVENGKQYIINQTLAHELLKDKPNTPISSLVGEKLGFGGMDTLGTIIGIARDFNFNSLHYKIETMFLFNQQDWGLNNISVKINGSSPAQAIAFIRSSWKNIYPGYPFEYHFLDEHFAEIYSADKEVSLVVGILASLAILISCLGLFGLASHAAERRVKEIGIRKVLGASVQGIAGMLSRDFLQLVILANLLAWPMAWLLVHKWLQNFAYQVAISWWVFGLAGLCSIGIAWLTIYFKSVRAGMANPVNSLRTE